MTEHDPSTTPETTDPTAELEVPSGEQQAPESAPAGSGRVAAWVVPVAVGAAGVVLSIATGIGGFVAGVQASDKFDLARGNGHAMSDDQDRADRSFEGRGEGRGKREGKGFGFRGDHGGEGFGGQGRGPGAGSMPQDPAQGSMAG